MEWIHLILTKTPRGKDYHPHFTIKESKRQKLNNLPKLTQLVKMWGLGMLMKILDSGQRGSEERGSGCSPSPQASEYWVWVDLREGAAWR